MEARRKKSSRIKSDYVSCTAQPSRELRSSFTVYQLNKVLYPASRELRSSFTVYQLNKVRHNQAFGEQRCKIKDLSPFLLLNLLFLPISQILNVNQWKMLPYEDNNLNCYPINIFLGIIIYICTLNYNTSVLIS